MLEMKHTHVVWKQMFCKFDHDNRLFILYMFAVLDFCMIFAIMLQGFCYYMCVHFI